MLVSTPTVSTIIPVFNRGALLREAVRSVLAQGPLTLEILVVDNASSDDTPQVAAALAAAHPGVVRVLTCEERGAGAAREVGRQAARGEFVQYLDSDDVLAPGKFARQVAALRASPSCDICYGATRYLAADGSVLHEAWKRTGEVVDALLPSMLDGRWWGTSTPLYRRALLDRAGPWLNLLNEEDWEYDCRLGALQASLCRVDGCVSEERDHPGERLSRGGARDPEKLRSRADAHERVLGHALCAGVRAGGQEMRRFSRSLFLLARQCAAAGLPAESAKLLGLARRAAGGPRVDIAVYGAVSRVVGWRAAGRLSVLLDRWLGAR